MAAATAHGTCSSSVVVFAHAGSTPEVIATGVQESKGVSSTKSMVAPGIYNFAYNGDYGFPIYGPGN